MECVKEDITAHGISTNAVKDVKRWKKTHFNTWLRTETILQAYKSMGDVSMRWTALVYSPSIASLCLKTYLMIHEQ